MNVLKCVVKVLAINSKKHSDYSCIFYSSFPHLYHYYEHLKCIPWDHKCCNTKNNNTEPCPDSIDAAYGFQGCRAIDKKTSAGSFMSFMYLCTDDLLLSNLDTTTQQWTWTKDVMKNIEWKGKKKKPTWSHLLQWWISSPEMSCNFLCHKILANIEHDDRFVLRI